MSTSIIPKVRESEAIAQHVVMSVSSLQHNKDNPFVTGHHPQETAGVVTKKLSGWNPFEDTVSFGAVTEDFIFGTQAMIMIEY